MFCWKDMSTNKEKKLKLNFVPLPPEYYKTYFLSTNNDTDTAIFSEIPTEKRSLWFGKQENERVYTMKVPLCVKDQHVQLLTDDSSDGALVVSGTSTTQKLNKNYTVSIFKKCVVDALVKQERFCIPLADIFVALELDTGKLNNVKTTLESIESAPPKLKSLVESMIATPSLYCSPLLLKEVFLVALDEKWTIKDVLQYTFKHIDQLNEKLRKFNSVPDGGLRSEMKTFKKKMLSSAEDDTLAVTNLIVNKIILDSFRKQESDSDQNLQKILLNYDSDEDLHWSFFAQILPVKQVSVCCVMQTLDIMPVISTQPRNEISKQNILKLLFNEKSTHHTITNDSKANVATTSKFDANAKDNNLKQMDNMQVDFDRGFIVTQDQFGNAGAAESIDCGLCLGMITYVFTASKDAEHLQELQKEQKELLKQREGFRMRYLAITSTQEKPALEYVSKAQLSCFYVDSKSNNGIIQKLFNVRESYMQFDKFISTCLTNVTGQFFVPDATFSVEHVPCEKFSNIPQLCFFITYGVLGQSLKKRTVALPTYKRSANAIEEGSHKKARTIKSDTGVRNEIRYVQNCNMFEYKKTDQSTLEKYSEYWKSGTIYTELQSKKPISYLTFAWNVLCSCGLNRTFKFPDDWDKCVDNRMENNADIGITFFNTVAILKYLHKNNIITSIPDPFNVKTDTYEYLKSEEAMEKLLYNERFRTSLDNEDFKAEFMQKVLKTEDEVYFIFKMLFFMSIDDKTFEGKTDSDILEYTKANQDCTPEQVFSRLSEVLDAMK